MTDTLKIITAAQREDEQAMWARLKVFDAFIEIVAQAVVELEKMEVKHKPAVEGEYPL